MKNCKTFCEAEAASDLKEVIHFCLAPPKSFLRPCQFRLYIKWGKFQATIN